MRPTWVAVGVLRYAITTDPALLDNDAYGEFRPQAGEVAISPNLPPTLEKEIVWHELKHAAAFSAGFRDEDKKHSEEEWVTRTSGPELALLQDNPQLREFLFST